MCFTPLIGAISAIFQPLTYYDLLDPLFTQPTIYSTHQERSRKARCFLPLVHESRRAGQCRRSVFPTTGSVKRDMMGI